MINYTERLTLLMEDIIARVPTLAFINPSDVLIFARHGRRGSAGAFATCHCLSLPDSEPGYYFWRERGTDRITRRSEWFVTKSPTVTIDGHRVKYLISFTLPRFCDQALNRSRKERFYRRATDSWVAKLDTVIHELYHIDPEHNGIRRVERPDGTCSSNAHSPEFFARVADMVSQYLDAATHSSAYEFLMHDFETLEARHGGVGGVSFRRYPAYPRRFIERLSPQPVTVGELAEVQVAPWKTAARQSVYTEADLHLRRFLGESSRQLVRKREIRAA